MKKAIQNLFIEVHKHNVDAKCSLYLNNKRPVAKAGYCRLFQERVTFGHVILSKGIEPHPKKISYIASWPEHKCLTEMRSFLGLASYCENFASFFTRR